jgi:hypothetical protein
MHPAHVFLERALLADFGRPRIGEPDAACVERVRRWVGEPENRAPASVDR